MSLGIFTGNPLLPYPSWEGEGVRIHSFRSYQDRDVKVLGSWVGYCRHSATDEPTDHAEQSVWSILAVHHYFCDSPVLKEQSPSKSLQDSPAWLPQTAVQVTLSPTLGRRDRLSSGLWLAGNEGMERNMETAILGYIGITIRIHSFIPS